MRREFADNLACTGGGTCTDKSNLTVGFNINSGPNAGSQGFTTTNASGVASLTYSDVGGAGLDTLQACLDADPSSPGVADENFVCTGGTNNGTLCATDLDCTGGGKCKQLVSLCIADALTAEPDFASNTATKRWDPSLLLQNLDAGATLAAGSNVFTVNPAFNPLGSSHMVQATIVGAANICFGGTAGANSYATCSSNANCTNGGTCGIAGYPVFFGVISGPNTADLGGAVLTNSAGVASKTYGPGLVAGTDTIQACVDADLTEGIPDDVSFSECLADYQGGATTGQADVPSKTVLKNWLSTFVTGGGKVTSGKSLWDTFGGTVGYKPNSTTLTGEWTQQAHSKGTLNCHWNTVSAFTLSCSTASCGAQPDTAVFTVTGGGATCGSESVKIVDGGKKADTITVFNATNTALNWSPSSLVSGNFTIHK